MGPRPGRIVEIIEVYLPRPRRLDQFASTPFDLKILRMRIE
jgi:hypothetical protein